VRRVLAVLTVIVMMVVSVPKVQALSRAYKLDEVGINISVPENFLVLTRDMPAYMYESVGISQQDFLKDAGKQDIYLDGISVESGEEVVVTMTPSSIGEYSLMSDTTLMVLASSFEDVFYEAGVMIFNYEIYAHGRAKFIELNVWEAESGKYSLQYTTVANGKMINVTLHSYRHSITAEQQRMMRGVVDSIAFHTPPPMPDPIVHTKAFVYKDEETGATFTVPDDWRTGELSKPREYIKDKFVSLEEEGLTICYGSTDIWMELTPEEKLGYTREDLHMGGEFDQYFIEGLGYSGISTTEVTYNGVPYYHFESTESRDVYGMNVTITMTGLIHFHDGVAYMFQFSGTSDHAYYKDFEKLIKSVTYPTSGEGQAVTNMRTTAPTEATGGITSRTVLVPQNDIPHKEAALAILWILLIIAVATMTALIVFWSKESIRKKKAAKQAVEGTDTVSVEEADDKLYCYKCGKRIPLDSEFCQYCGKRIPKEEPSSRSD